MSVTYFDVRWAGALPDITSALAALGWAVNANGSVTLADPEASASAIVGVCGGQAFTVEGTSYVTFRATSPIPLPSTLSDPGPDQAATITGVWAPP